MALSRIQYGALLVPPASVYTFLFFWRDFFALDATLFHFARLLFIWRDLFLFGETFFIWRDFFSLTRPFFIRRDFFLCGAIFFLATESNRFPKSPEIHSSKWRLQRTYVTISLRNISIWVIFFKIETSERHTATVVVNFVYCPTGFV